ncbi:MAG TPA: GNAT family protein [Candidatus Saccharimonadales bacterium]|nr:GNAT family protein [Candidatus Saccharimonadales bacterium]
MFGINMRIEYDGFGVALRPLSKADLPVLVEHFNSMKIHYYTQGLFAQTLENETEWYEKKRKEETSCLWGIVPDGSEVAVGITEIHGINTHGSCETGFIIWDTSWWDKGVATRSHLGRTLFASDYLNRLTIRSSARVENGGSVNALTRVGYVKTGVEPRTYFRAGRFLDTQLFCWLNPERIGILFPEGLPSQYEDGVQKAQVALTKARQVVSFP